MAIVISETECSWSMCHPGSHSPAERVAMAQRDKQEMQIILGVYPYNKLKRFYDSEERNEARAAAQVEWRDHGKKMIHMRE